MKQIAFTWLLCILSICAYAQQITVTGTVTDAENNPLIGAAVVVVGTTDGVITDFDGKYTICLLYTSDAADELDGVDLGGRRIIKKK